MTSENCVVIDGRELSFEQDETIFQVARRNGINIPTLCLLRGASPTGNCRVCLVEVEGVEDLITSCSEPAISGMVIRTSTPKVVEGRCASLEKLLASGNHNCLVQGLDMDSWTDFQLKAMDPDAHRELCPAYGECQLQDLAVRYGVRLNRFVPVEDVHPVEDVNPLIVRDLSRCILCGKCVKACNEIQVNNAISFDDIDSPTRVIAGEDSSLKDSDCVFCGECVQACPVGALVVKKDFRQGGLDQDVKQVRTTCSYCGVGCQLYLHVKDNNVVRVTGVEDVKPNYGSLCVKGRFGYDFINDPQRLKRPLIKENGEFREASWDEALDLVAERLAFIKKEAGPDSIGVLCSARITNEENYLSQKFARVVIGTNNVDHCARL